MIVCRGDKAVFIGLTHHNLELMQQGKPVTFTGNRVGLPEDVHVFIFAKEDDRTLLAELSDAGVVDEEQVADALRDSSMRLP